MSALRATAPAPRCAAVATACSARRAASVAPPRAPRTRRASRLLVRANLFDKLKDIIPRVRARAPRAGAGPHAPVATRACRVRASARRLCPVRAYRAPRSALRGPAASFCAAEHGHGRRTPRPMSLAPPLRRAPLLWGSSVPPAIAGPRTRDNALHRLSPSRLPQDEEGKDDGRGGRETTKGSIIELIGFGLGAPVPSDVRALTAHSVPASRHACPFSRLFPAHARTGCHRCVSTRRT
jgi:hypothetical protein